MAPKFRCPCYIAFWADEKISFKNCLLTLHPTPKSQRNHQSKVLKVVVIINNWSCHWFWFSTGSLQRQMEQFTLWLSTNRRKMYLTFSIYYASDKYTQFFLAKGCGILSQDAGTRLISKHADTKSGALVIASFTKIMVRLIVLYPSHLKKHRLWVEGKATLLDFIYCTSLKH